MEQEDFKVVAIYARISKKDTGRPEQPQSIDNQIRLAKEYICRDEELSQMRIRVFQDVGYSGTSMERPAVRTLLANIYLGRVQALVVKDFSRFSRNHILLSTFREEVFPRYSLDFISIGDYYDGRKPGQQELCAGFRSIFYEYYCRDVSRKVKDALEAKKQNGEYAVAMSPYGYRKDREGGFVVEKSEGDRVRAIFEMAADGHNCVRIAELLNQERELEQQRKEAGMESRCQPEQQRKEAGMESRCQPEQQRKEAGMERQWQPEQIWRILHNPVYCGYQVWHKYENRYWNGFCRQCMERKEWRLQTGSHQSLVSEELFYQAQNRQNTTASYGRKKGRRHVFHGLTKCAVCRKALCRHRQKPELLCCKTRHEEGMVLMDQQLLWEICLEAVCDSMGLTAPPKIGGQKDRRRDRERMQHMYGNGRGGWNYQEKEQFLNEFFQEIAIGEQKEVWIRWKVRKEKRGR